MLGAWLELTMGARVRALRRAPPGPLGEAAADQAEWFQAWLWDPRFQTHGRGFATVRLGVRPGGLTLFPRHAESLIHGWDEPIEYDWPVVVSEQLLPLMSRGLLVDVRGAAGLCIVRHDRALRESLARAGLTVIEIRRWGWDSPRRVHALELSAHIADVPRSIVRPAGG